MACIDDSDCVKQLITYNNELGDVLNEVAALTDVMVEVDFANLKTNTQQQFFMLVDAKVINVIAIQRNMAALLEKT